jgi:Tfp pilus assembly protein PilN
MIQINLLPEELRRNTRTSPKALALLFIVSVVSFGSAGFTGFLWFNVKADREARVQIAQDQLDGLTPRAKYADNLSKEKAEFDKRNKTITEIASSRVVWTKKLDRLSEIVNRDVTQGRHKVWMSSVDVDTGSDTKAGQVKVEGFSAGKNIDNYTNFHDDLKNDPVFKEGFAEYTAPSAKVEDPEAGVEPPEKTEFKFDVKMTPKDPKKKTAGKAPAKPATTATKPSGS